MSLQDLLNEKADKRMELKDAINKIIADHDLNYPRLAQMLDKQTTPIWQYAKGKTKKCHIETARLIYKHFGIVVKPFHEIELVGKETQGNEPCDVSAPVVENHDTTEASN